MTTTDTSTAGPEPTLRPGSDPRIGTLLVALRARGFGIGLEERRRLQTAFPPDREVRSTLARSGLSVHLGRFLGVPQRIVLDTGEVLEPEDLEGETRQAAVSPCSPTAPPWPAPWSRPRRATWCAGACATSRSGRACAWWPSAGRASWRASPACASLYGPAGEPDRRNPRAMGASLLLRAGALAEPIRACAERWPDLSVAVIAAAPGDIPARRLAIRLLDQGAADLALIGPDWAEQARALGAEWAFVKDSQWLFFSPRPSGEGPGVRTNRPAAPTRRGT